MRQDPSIPVPTPGDEYYAGLPRNKAPVQIDGPPTTKGFDRSPNYVRNMGDDTPIQAYSLRDDYERNAEWYPTKTIRDWKTVDIKDEYPNTKATKRIRSKNTESTRITPKYKATNSHWGSTTDPTEFDRSRG